MDYFSDQTCFVCQYPYDNINEEPLGPFCLKGIEIHKNQPVETTIVRAINQLSFAFVDKLISAISCQLNDTNAKNTIFYNVPIIITNADLYLINEKAKTTDIKKASTINDIASKHNFLIYCNQIGEELKNYNYERLNDFFDEYGINKVVERFNTFTKDYNHFINVISTYYCPRAMLIMHHDENYNNYDKLFKYLRFLLIPSKQRDDRIEIVIKESKKRFKELEDKIKKRKKS